MRGASGAGDGAEAKRAPLVRTNLFPLSCAGVEAA